MELNDTLTACLHPGKQGFVLLRFVRLTQKKIPGAAHLRTACRQVATHTRWRFTCTMVPGSWRVTRKQKKGRGECN